MRYLAILAIMSLTALPAKACQLALVLGIDVSHSIDANEYRTQVTGLAEALRDPVIAATLVDLEVALTVVQWSGSDQQDISIPWQRMLTKRHITRFENRIRGLSRPWDSSNTGVGAALQKMLDQFDQVRDCQRKVIDFSGDGVSNAGPLPIAARGRAQAMGVVINGLAIDRLGLSVTQYYKGHVTTGRDSFVVTATGYHDYPRAIREKLFRELLPPSS